MNDQAIRDYLVSVVRTWVPIGWGALLVWLVSRGVIDDNTAAAAGSVGAGLGMLLAVCAGWLFYAAARAVEPLFSRHPAGRLLLRLAMGIVAPPTYPPAYAPTGPPADGGGQR